MRAFLGVVLVKRGVFGGILGPREFSGKNVLRPPLRRPLRTIMQVVGRIVFDDDDVMGRKRDD